MATYSEMSLTTRLFMKQYPFWRYRIDPVPSQPLRQPISRSKVALVTTAGFCPPGQTPFDNSIKKGDCTWREIPGSIETATLIESHRSQSFDHRGVEADRNLAFPLDRFRELLADGVIGSLNHRHFSFMGSIVGPRQLIDERAPEVAQLLKEDGVEIAFLTPV